MKNLCISFFLLSGLSHLAAQDFSMIRRTSEPINIQSMGSFYVGGDSNVASKTQVGDFGSEGHITTGQMYVQYMEPAKLKDETSFVMIHGMTLTGKTYETTPDGRMGWYEYFVRKGYSTYVVDQPGFGRSGFNQKPYNEVRSGQLDPKKQPVFIRFSDEDVWPLFRVGTVDGKKFSDGKFSKVSYRELSKQSIPFSPLSKKDSISNYKNLEILASKIKNTLLISHSQSGDFPLETELLSTEGIKGAVIIEPGFVSKYNDEEIKTFTKVPLLVIFGDNLSNPSNGSNFTWEISYTGWKTLVERIVKAGGNAKMYHLPELGIKGNSHMIMQDDNNLEIADLILKWKESL